MSMDDERRPSRDSRVWLLVIAALIVLLIALLVPGEGVLYTTIAAVIVALAIAITVWALLRARSDRRHYETRLTEWAAERAVQADRLRIARDLHDLASHGLGLMTVRAATANLTDDEDDAERRQALTDIEHVGRETTTELRRMLVLLRTGDAPAPLRPTDSLADLPTIIEQARRGGLTVEVEQENLGEVSPGVQLTICAVIREALANTLQYAGPGHVRLSIERARNAISVDCRDSGPVADWRPHPGTGNGLRGLRERLGLHNGTLTTGPAGTGFRLLAEIPEHTA